MKLHEEIPDSDIDWDIRTSKSPLGRTATIQPSSQDLNDAIDDAPPLDERTDNTLAQSTVQLPDLTSNIIGPGLNPLLDVAELESLPRSRFSRPGRANLTAYLAKDQRDHAHDLASQASSDDDFGSSEVELGLQDDEHSQFSSASVPSSPILPSPTHHRGDIFGLRQRQRTVIDSDFSDSASENETSIIQGGDFDGVFHNRLMADLPASHIPGDSDYNQNSYSGIFGAENENDLSQSQSQSRSQLMSLSQFEDNYALEGTGGIDYMMQRPSRTSQSKAKRPNKRPTNVPAASGGPSTRLSKNQSLSVHTLLGHMGPQASQIIKVAARTARDRGKPRSDNPQRKLISGVGAGAQRILKTWKDGNLDLTPRRATAVTSKLQLPPSQRLPLDKEELVSKKSRVTQQTRSEDAIKVPRGLREQPPEINTVAPSRQRRRKTPKPTRRRGTAQNSRTYHTTVLEREHTKLTKRYKLSADSSEEKAAGNHQNKPKSSDIRLNESVVLGIQKARGWLSTPQVTILEIKTLQSSFGPDTFAGSVLGSDCGWKLRKQGENISSLAIVEQILKGLIGMVTPDVYSAVYDYFLERVEVRFLTQSCVDSDQLDKWVALLRMAVLQNFEDSFDIRASLNLVVAVACLVASKGLSLDINKLVMEMIFNNMNQVVLEQKQHDTRYLPGTELVRLACHFRLFSGDTGLAMVLGDSQRSFAARWQFVMLVATSLGYGTVSGESPIWKDVRLLTTPTALGSGSESPCIAMDAYLKLLTNHGWVPCPDVVIDCFNFFAKQQQHVDAEGELTEIPSMIWRDSFDGRSRPDGDRQLFLEVLGSSLHILNQKGESAACMRIVGRVTPLSQFQFPETLPVQVSEMSTVSHQYALLLVMIREGSVELRPKVRQVRDLVNLHNAHVYIRAKALSAWQILVMISRHRVSDLLECRDWVANMVKESISDIYTEGKPAAKAVIVQAARCCVFVIQHGVPEVVVPVVLFQDMVRCSMQVRREILNVALALANTGQVDLLGRETKQIVDSLQTVEETATWARVASIIYPSWPELALYWPHESTRAAFYAALVPRAGVQTREIVSQALDSSLKPEPNSMDDELVDAASKSLVPSREAYKDRRLELAKRLVGLCAKAEWGIEVLDQLLRQMSNYIAEDTDYKQGSIIRRLSFEAFPDLQRSHAWDSLSSYDDRVETVQGYILRMLQGERVMGKFSFFARRLKNALEESREEAFLVEMLDAIAMSSDKATIKAAVELLDNVYAAFFEAAPWLMPKLESALPLLVRLANEALKFSDCLELLPQRFIMHAVRYCNFVLHSNIMIDANDAGRALITEIVKMGTLIMRQTMVAEVRTQSEQPAIPFGISALVYRYNHRSELNRPRPLDSTPPEYVRQACADLAAVFNSLRYVHPPVAMDDVRRALDDFEYVGIGFNPILSSKHDDFAWPDGDCQAFSEKMPGRYN